jgi:hypothetical protein
MRPPFTLRGHTITTALFSDTDGRLVNCESDDRSRSLCSQAKVTPYLTGSDQL